MSRQPPAGSTSKPPGSKSDVRRMLRRRFKRSRARPMRFTLFPMGLVSANRTRIATFALTARLPTIWVAREYVETGGGLLSYGPSYSDLFRRAAEITDKILRGAKPADIPVEQPTKYDFVINLTTAKALGLTIPESLLLRADKVIE